MTGKDLGLDKLLIISAGSVAGLACAIWVYNLSWFPNFTDLVVGYSTWSGTGKVQDVLSPLLFVVVTCCFVATLVASFRVSFSAEFNSLLTISLWLAAISAGAVLSGGGGVVWKLNASAALVVVATITIAGTTLSGSPLKPLPAISGAVGAFGSILGVLVAFDRGAGPISWEGEYLAFSAVLAILISVFFQCLKLPVVSLYFGCPALFVILIPRDSIDNVSYYTPNAFLYVLVSFLVVAAYWEQIMRARKGEVFPVLSILAIVLSLKIAGTYAPIIRADDYHFGESILPWWSLYRFGLLPFVDFAPPHGGVDYFDDFFGWAFFDGTSVGNIAAGQRLAYSFSASLIFVPLAVRFGALPAALLALLMPLHSPAFAVLVPALTAATSSFLLARPILWSVSWATSCAALLILAPGYGAAFGVASLPLAVWITIASTRENGPPYLIRLAVTASAWLAVAAFSGVAAMVIAAALYAVDNASVNLAAYGSFWNWSWRGVGPHSGWLFEAIRTSWMIVPILATYRICVLYRAGQFSLISTSPAIVVAILPLIMLSYSMGRIEPASASRPGLMSIFSVLILLPMLFENSVRALTSKCIIFGAFIAGYLSFSADSATFGFNQNLLKAPSAQLQSVAGNGDLSSVVIDADQKIRIETVRRTMDEILRPDETYVDLTGRHALYRYVDRKPPIPTTAPFNLASSGAQLAAVKRLERQPPQAALLWADNYNWEGQTPALRTYWLYRYAALRFVPFERDGIIFGATPDRLPADTQAATVAQRLDLLDRAFLHKELSALPRVWGASFEKSLRFKFVPVKDVLPGVREKGMAISFDLGGISGAEAGALLVKLSCENRFGASRATFTFNSELPAGEAVSGEIDVGWNIIPFDSQPRWLLSRQVDFAHIEFVGKHCTKVNVEEAWIARRRGS